METETYEMLAARQDHYWWHKARRDLSIALLRRFNAPQNGTWLDLGCGPGGNLSVPAVFKSRLVVGVDLSALAIGLAESKLRKTCFVRADVSLSLPFSSHACDIVTIFNVLYHRWIGNEATVLNEVNRVLKPGGFILVTEPAFSILARQMDVAAMGRKRYRRTDIMTLCGQAGFEVLFASYFTSFGFPILLALRSAHLFTDRLYPARRTAVDMRPLPAVLNEMLYGLASIECAVLNRNVRIPFGTTIICLARKLPSGIHQQSEACSSI